MRRLLAAALLLGACASSPRRPGPTPAEPVDVEQLYAELHNRDLELRNTFLAADAESLAGCERMMQLRDNICALAESICRIADKRPAGSQAATYCTEGKARCKNANDRTQSRGCRKAQLH